MFRFVILLALGTALLCLAEGVGTDDRHSVIAGATDYPAHPRAEMTEGEQRPFALHSPMGPRGAIRARESAGAIAPASATSGDAAQDQCVGTSAVPALVTVQTYGPEQFIVRVTEQTLLDETIDICLGLSPQKIVLADLLTGNAGYNRDPLTGVPWSWHFDEDTLSLVDVPAELCDGVPSFVEAYLQYWVESVGSFCPWSTQIVAVGPDTSLPGDFNIDGDIDLADFELFQPCMTGPSDSCFVLPTGCCASDVDGDTDLDLIDFGAFQRVFSGT